MIYMIAIYVRLRISVRGSEVKWFVGVDLVVVRVALSLVAAARDLARATLFLDSARSMSLVLRNATLLPPLDSQLKLRHRFDLIHHKREETHLIRRDNRRWDGEEFVRYRTYYKAVGGAANSRL